MGQRGFWDEQERRAKLNQKALLDLWLELYRRIRFFLARGAETLVRLKHKPCLSPNTQENPLNSPAVRLSFSHPLLLLGRSHLRRFHPEMFPVLVEVPD